MEEAIISHNPHWNAKPYKNLFYRGVIDGLIETITQKEIQVLQGIRRSGKSTIFKLLINHLIENKNPQSILYINFDDPYFSEMWRDSKELYRLLELSEKITTTKPQYIFFDEIQNVVMWEKFIKTIYDNELVSKIFVTGSNSSLLSSEYAVALSGRYYKEIIYPLSFREICTHQQIGSYFKLLSNKPKILNIVDSMMEYGSFPEVYKKETRYKRALILSYYETIILKDCIANHGIREVKRFQELTNYLVSNVASLYGYSSISKAVGINENTIKEYIYALEDSYLYRELKQFSYSLKKQIRSRKKAYLIDNSFLGNISFRFSKNRGKLFENLVFSELQKRGFEVSIFNESSFECDFIARKDEELLAIQVCYELHNSNRDREIKGLINIDKTIRQAKKILITYDQEEQSGDIEIVSFWKYFFEDI